MMVNTMKIVMLLIAYKLVVAMAARPQHIAPPGLDEEWRNFKRNYGMKYNNPTAELHRKDVFLKNLEKIQNHNKLVQQGKSSFKMAVNEFADMDHDEFVTKMTGLLPENGTQAHSVHKRSSRSTGPLSVDWRQQGAVTSVKHQGECGSCWAFCVAGAIESHHFIKTAKSVDLSEQQLVDCSNNLGCNGGDISVAFQYAKEHGLVSENDYPYTAKSGATCEHDPSGNVATISSFVNGDRDTNENIMNIVAEVGPLCVSVHASLESFRFYSEGVYYDPDCPSNPDHGLLLVGYGDRNGEDYWILKNSWGESWGEDGYMYLTRNKKKNQCGFGQIFAYPLN